MWALTDLATEFYAFLKGADVKAKLFKQADEKECIFRFAFNEFRKLGLLILHQKYL